MRFLLVQCANLVINMLTLVLLLFTIGLLLVGCATLANTPAQERTWAAIEKCKALQPNGNMHQVSRVGPDGRYYLSVGDWGAADYASARLWQACIRDRWREGK